ncbi:hypothetical protein KL86DPRO_10032 [uncultured delta proteobacterium]|uniref:Uncharacterized protein n=1 Tax=uncultured delta proteobacterium TaxID=34034 RepID=A0A212ITD6_9DELT|nr:hypothetical protein KL86DPRO_10032 [uncultured delta proteobacterium]
MDKTKKIAGTVGFLCNVLVFVTQSG